MKKDSERGGSGMKEIESKIQERKVREGDRGILFTFLNKAVG